MTLPQNNFTYYMQQVQLTANQQRTQFPTAGTEQDYQLRVKNAINSALRYFNNNYWLNFQEAETLITPTAQFADPTGIPQHDLSLPPYSVPFWKVSRMGKNAVVRANDGIVMPFLPYTEMDYMRPQFTIGALGIFWCSFGPYLRFFPKSPAFALKIRYYPLAVATDSAGVLKNKLVDATDLPTMGDEWEDAIIWMAVKFLRMQDKADARTNEVNAMAKHWESILAEKHKAGPEEVTVFTPDPQYPQNRLREKTWPFGTGLSF